MRSFFVILLSMPFSLFAGTSGLPAQDPGFLEEPSFGETSIPPEQGLLVAYSVGVKLTAPELHLCEKATVGNLIPAVYPSALLNANITGKAEVTFDLKVDGTIEHISIFRSTHPALAEAAIAAVKSWKLSPLVWASSPKTVRVTASFIFSIFHD